MPASPEILVAVLIIGLLIGSFFNVVIHRLPRVMIYNWKKECAACLELAPPAEAPPPGIVFPRSHCPTCKAPIKAWQNIPLVSYLMLKGRCANCRVRISLRYPVVEAVTGLLSLFVIYRLGLTPAGGLALVFTWALLVLSLIDVDHQLLPDDITLPLLWLGLLANSVGVFTDLQSALLGAVFGYLSLWSFYWLFKLLTGKEGMGYGDFKLLAALGAWMGWQPLLLIIVLSSLVGAVIGIGGILVLGRNRNLPIPFGPYLAIAGWLAFFWGDRLIAQYFRLMTPA